MWQPEFQTRTEFISDPSVSPRPFGLVRGLLKAQSALAGWSKPHQTGSKVGTHNQLSDVWSSAFASHPASPHFSSHSYRPPTIPSLLASLHSLFLHIRAWLGSCLILRLLDMGLHCVSVYMFTIVPSRPKMEWEKTRRETTRQRERQGDGQKQSSERESDSEIPPT